MKKQVVKTIPQYNGTKLVYADGTSEVVEDLFAGLNEDKKDSDVEEYDDEEEPTMKKLMEKMRKGGS